MRSIVMLIFFLGVFLIITGIYEQKYEALKKNKHIEYRFIPKTYLEEQLSNPFVSGLFKNNFNKVDPWFDRNVGEYVKSAV